MTLVNVPQTHTHNHLSPFCMKMFINLWFPFVYHCLNRVAQTLFSFVFHFSLHKNKIGSESEQRSAIHLQGNYFQVFYFITFVLKCSIPSATEHNSLNSLTFHRF